MIPLERREEERKKEPTPFITNLILVTTILIQIYISIIPKGEALRIYETYSLVPVQLFDGVHIDSLFTYMFLHGNLVHLLVNSIALYGTGRTVERDIGNIKYLLVFIISGVAAGIFHSYLNPFSSAPLVGSSGAIFGVIATLFLLMPFKITFALIVPLPSVIVGVMLSIVELSAFWMQNDLGIAHDAHLAGFITGCVCAFAIDRDRALKGLIIAGTVVALLYYLGVYFGLIST